LYLCVKMLPMTKPKLDFYEALYSFGSSLSKAKRQNNRQEVEWCFKNDSIDFNQAFLLCFTEFWGKRKSLKANVFAVKTESYSIMETIYSVRRCRLMWVLIFLSACALLLWLISQKIMYLQTNPKNVNLDFNFNDTLPFPAVTICNQSPYRCVARWGRITLRRTPYATNPSETKSLNKNSPTTTSPDKTAPI